MSFKVISIIFIVIFAVTHVSAIFYCLVNISNGGGVFNATTGQTIGGTFTAFRCSLPKASSCGVSCVILQFHKFQTISSNTELCLRMRCKMLIGGPMMIQSTAASTMNMG